MADTTTKSISELQTQPTANSGDLFAVSVPDAGSDTGYSSAKESAAVVAAGIVSSYLYPTELPNMQNRTITGALNVLLGNIAAVYDDTATYAAGDYCTYNGQLYKANQAISTAESFDATHWDATTIMAEIGGGS